MDQPNSRHQGCAPIELGQLPTRVRSFRPLNLTFFAHPNHGHLGHSPPQGGMQWGSQGPYMYDPAADPRHEADLTSGSVEPAVTSHEGLAANRRQRSKIKPKGKQTPLKVKGTQQSTNGKPIDIVQHNPCAGDGWNKRHSKQKPREKQSEEEKRRRKGMVEHGSCISCAYRKKQCDREETCDKCKTNKWTCIRWPEEAWLWNQPKKPSAANNASDTEITSATSKEARLEEARNMSFSHSQKTLSSPKIRSALLKHALSLTIKSRTRNADPSLCDEFTTDCESFMSDALCFDVHRLAWSELDKKIASHSETLPLADKLEKQILRHKKVKRLHDIAANLKAVLHSNVYCRPGQIDFAKAVATLLLVRVCKMLAFAAQSISEMICGSIKLKGGDLDQAQQAIAVYYCVVEELRDALDDGKLTRDLKEDLENSVVSTHGKLIALFALTERCAKRGRKRGPRDTLKSFTRIITGNKHPTKSADEEAAHSSLDAFSGDHDIHIQSCPDLQIAIIPDPSTTQPNDQPFLHPFFPMADLLNKEPETLAESLGSTIADAFTPIAPTPLSPIPGSPGSEDLPPWNEPRPVSTAPGSPGRVSLKALKDLSPQPYRKRLAVHPKRPPTTPSSQSDTVVGSSTDATTITGGPLSPEPEPTDGPLLGTLPEKPPTAGPGFQPPPPPHRSSNFIMEKEFGGPLSPMVHDIGYHIHKYYRHDSFKTLAMHPKRQSTSGSESSVASLAQRFHRRKRMHVSSGLSDLN